MAKLTLKQRYQSALESRGYKVDRTSRITRYTVLVCQGGNPVTPGEHRILLGKSGALRMTRSTADRALDISAMIGTMLLVEANVIAREKTIGGKP